MLVLLRLLALEFMKRSRVYCVHLRVLVPLPLSVRLRGVWGTPPPVPQLLLVSVLPVLLLVLALSPLLAALRRLRGVKERPVDRLPGRWRRVALLLLFH